MTTIIDRPVFKELAQIQQDIGLPPSLKLIDYVTCRAYVQKSAIPCKMKLTKKREELDVLLFEFRHMTKCGDTGSFYNKIELYLTLTHCHIHYHKAYKAFIEWKTQRIAAASSLLSDPAKGATSSSDSLGTWSETSITVSPTPTSPISGTSGYDESASDLCLEKEMKHLAIDANAPDATRRICVDWSDGIKKLRVKLKEPLGTLSFPNAGKKKDNLKIFKVMENPLPPASMAQVGVLYIYEHTGISGIFKIGFSTKSAEERHKQPGNCYQVDTNIIYESKIPFMGAQQAEKIVHTALADTNFHVHNCRLCKGKKKGTHKEWFVTSKKQALTKVKGAESWLRLPAYFLAEAKFELTLEGRTIYDSKTRFSISDLYQHTDGDDISDNVSDALAAKTLAVDIQQISIPRSSSPVTENGLFTVHDDGSFTTTTSEGQEPQKVSLARTAGKSSNEALELTHKCQLPSKGSDNEKAYSQAKASRVLAHRQPNESSLEVNNDEEYNLGEASKTLVLRRSKEANLEVRNDIIDLFQSLLPDSHAN